MNLGRLHPEVKVTVLEDQNQAEQITWDVLVMGRQMPRSLTVSCRNRVLKAWAEVCWMPGSLSTTSLVAIWMSLLRAKRCSFQLSYAAL